ncbi:Transposase zinc-ribbon domain-containing protein [Methylobacterium pseudosasicola]|uniref:Transposase zinc-ribbon domain-containing protein n=2 Tax=Methylobacterium pseudosasicola TaxID=582667 RepID=A0A1I4R988_9HYPH|nr:Transposase zinc-ribbon domain-containing protein [Methylobacterium pseudosasicola]
MSFVEILATPTISLGDHSKPSHGNLSKFCLAALNLIFIALMPFIDFPRLPFFAVAPSSSQTSVPARQSAYKRLAHFTGLFTPNGPVYVATMPKLTPEPDLCRPYFQCEVAALECLERARWPHGPICPHCGSTGQHYDLRKTRPGLRKCCERFCRRQFSVKTGTCFNRSHIPTTKILQAIYLVHAHRGKNNIESVRINLKIDWKSAERLFRRVEDGVLRHRIGDTGRNYALMTDKLRNNPSDAVVAEVDEFCFNFSLNALFRLNVRPMS